MRVVKYADEYQLVLSLFNGNPSDVIVSWDIAEAVNGRGFSVFHYYDLVVTVGN